MGNYIIEKFDKLIKTKEEPTYESISIKNFFIEYDYATTYLSRLLKVRGFTVYMLFFKRAYFVEGKRKICIKLSELGKNLLSDLGKPMSKDVIIRGINDLLKIKIIEKVSNLKVGQVNEYIVKLPSELREVQLLIEKDKNKVAEINDNSKDDFYSDKQKRLEILKRDEYQCFYCRCDLQLDDFYLDHLHPRSDGGFNWKSNLVTSCRVCNNRKNKTNATDFLLENYRKSLIKQNEYLEQKLKLDKLNEEYTKLKNNTNSL